MKIEMYEAAQVAEEKIVRVRLFTTVGGVALRAVDAAGMPLNRGKLLTLSASGVYLCACVRPDLGFSQDLEGRVRLLHSGL